MRNKGVFITIILIIIIGAIVSFITLKQSKELKAMLNTSATTMSLTTGIEVRRSVQDNGTTLGKPVYADVIIEYKPTSNYTEKDVYDEILETLLNEHWQKEDLNSDQPGFFIASLPQDGFIIEASVSTQPDRGIVSILLRTSPRE